MNKYPYRFSDRWVFLPDIVCSVPKRKKKQTKQKQKKKRTIYLKKLRQICLVHWVNVPNDASLRAASLFQNRY